MTALALVGLVIFTLLFASAAHVLAPRKGRARKWWVASSAFLGPIPVIILLCLPNRDGFTASAT